MGATDFNPWIRLYGPTGVLVGTAGNGLSGKADAEIGLRATNSGTVTVVAGSVAVAGTGSYLLNLAKSPGAVFAAPGDEGGAMVNGAKYTGTIDLGDLDMWSFSANAGDTLVLRMATTNYNSFVRLFGPNGALVGAVG